MGGHLLRHTAASLMLSSGMTIKQVQDNLGHASIITTEKYLHLV
jgi:site-specific recombinase XerD